MSTLETSYPVEGVTVNVWDDPAATVTAPEGEIDPLLPADAVIV